jgi:peptidase E
MRGAILFNGNAESDEWLVRASAPFLHASRHRDPVIAASRRTLLVTAGWAEHEHDEGHVKRTLNAIGIPSLFDGGFDRIHQNLSLLGELDGVLAEAPELAEAFRELRRAEATARRFYLEHNAHTIDLFRRTLREAKAGAPELDLGTLLADVRHPSGPRALARHTLARELGRAFRTLESNDDHLFELLGDIERRAFDAAGALYHPAFRRAKSRLEERILSASTIFLFGGRLDLLLGALRFFRLRDVFVEALRRGAQLVAVSAGAMVLCERVIVYDDFAETPRDFQLYDRGLGIVQDIQVLPHCMERIQTDDPDNLAYLARRFRHHACVGLNQRSLLLLELSPRRASSIGDDDGVYVFGPDGRKRCHRGGEEVGIS